METKHDKMHPLVRVRFDAEARKPEGSYAT